VDALREARRGTTESLGHVHFRMRTLWQHVGADTLTFGEVLRDAEYREPALPPASPWLGDASPALPVLEPPTSGGVRQTGDDGPPASSLPNAVLLATPGDTVPVRWWLVQTLGANQQWSERVVPAGGSVLTLTPTDTIGAQWIAVTAISRTGVSGAPALWRVER
jgi:hypothetical protein